MNNIHSLKSLGIALLLSPVTGIMAEQYLELNNNSFLNESITTEEKYPINYSEDDHREDDHSEENETLIEGAWKGYYLDITGDRQTIKYNVSYEILDGEKKLSIQMINLDLEPVADFTYQLSDIRMKNENLSFKIPGKYDTKLCSLTRQQKNKYDGVCQSDRTTTGITSQITMIFFSE